MFELGKKYWIRIKGELKDINLKGEVIEENKFMVKIKQDSEKESIIMFNQILKINEAKDEI